MIDTLNINSAMNYKVDPQVRDHASLQSRFEPMRYYNRPVFLVDKALMDLIYPPRRANVLDPQKARKFIKKASSPTKGNEGGWFKELEDSCATHTETPDQLWEDHRLIVAAGVFIPSVIRYHADAASRWASKAGKHLSAGLPAIALCPERIAAWADEVKGPEAFSTLFRLVYQHELAHYRMWGRDNNHDSAYSSLWGRIIEESLANELAYQGFCNREKGVARSAILMQSLEYRGGETVRSESRSINRSLRWLGATLEAERKRPETLAQLWAAFGAIDYLLDQSTLSHLFHAATRRSSGADSFWAQMAYRVLSRTLV